MENPPKNIVKCPIAIEMTVSEERLNEYRDQFAEDNCFSEMFETSKILNIKYGMGVYPNDTDYHPGDTWLYFQLDHFYETVIEANVCISIESANHFQQETIFFGIRDPDDSGCISNMNCKGVKICKTEEFFDPEKKYIVDGKLTLKMDGFLLIEEGTEYEAVYLDGEKVFKPENNLIVDDFDSSLCLGLWKQETKDFVIVVDGNEIDVHKCVLAARSPVFARMFETKMQEADERKAIIEDFSFQIVETAIKFCYHHSLASDTSFEDKMQLLQFFDKYNIESIKNAFEKYLIAEIDESNICRLSNCSLITNSLKLKAKCIEFLRECLQTSKPICDFEILDKDFAWKLLKDSFCNFSEIPNEKQ